MTDIPCSWTQEADQIKGSSNSLHWGNGEVLGLTVWLQSRDQWTVQKNTYISEAFSNIKDSPLPMFHLGKEMYQHDSTTFQKAGAAKSAAKVYKSVRFFPPQKRPDFCIYMVLLQCSRKKVSKRPGSKGCFGEQGQLIATWTAGTISQ